MSVGGACVGPVCVGSSVAAPHENRNAQAIRVASRRIVSPPHFSVKLCRPSSQVFKLIAALVLPADVGRGPCSAFALSAIRF